MKLRLWTFLLTALSLIGVSAAWACQNAPQAVLVDSAVTPSCLSVNSWHIWAAGMVCEVPSLVIENRCSSSVVLDKILLGTARENKKPAPQIAAMVSADSAESKTQHIYFASTGSKCDLPELFNFSKEQKPKCSSIILQQNNVVYLAFPRGAFYSVEGHIENAAPENELYAVHADGRLINPGDPDRVLKDEDLFPATK